MSKRLILILVIAFVAGLTIAAYAEVQNVKVSGDLTLQGISRRNIILRKHNLAPIHAPTQTTFVEYGQNISGVLSHVRVRVDADLTDNVSATVRLINERVWDEEDSVDTDIDLDLAYVMLKEFLYSPLSVKIGRQELMFGNQLIIGDPDTNGIMAGHGLAAGTAGTILPKSLDDLTLRKAFDAVRATLNYDPLVVDAVYAKVDENAIDGKEDVNLYGLNANYALDKNTTLEGYYWEKERQKADIGTAGTDSHKDVVRTLGARGQYSGIKNLMLGVEGAYQFGFKVNNTTLYPDDLFTSGRKKRSAWAAQGIAQYNLSEMMGGDLAKYQPGVGASYTILSGERYRSTKETHRGWDPMFENQAGGTLFNKILGYSNAQLVNVNASVMPMEDVKLLVDYYHLRFLKPYEIVGIAPNGVNLTGVAGDPTYSMVPGKKEIGNEVDATLTYAYTEDVMLGLSLGWFFPGDAFDNANDEVASQVIGSMKVTF